MLRLGNGCRLSMIFLVSPGDHSVQARVGAIHLVDGHHVTSSQNKDSGSATTTCGGNV